MKEYISRSAAETTALGAAFGKQLASNTIICFFGDLAAGKTTFIKGLVSAAADYDAEFVQSPTFNYLNVYMGTISIYHFDLYRFHGPDEFLSMGFDELFDADGICCIEWSEKIVSLLPDRYIRIEMTHEAEDVRRIIIKESL